MGLILKKIQLENYTEREMLYSKMIRGGYEFDVEPHYLEGGHSISIYLYREHPRMKEFIEKNTIHKTLNTQYKNITMNIPQLKFSINDNNFMITGCDNVNVSITEYNLPKDLGDCPKGKVGILIDIQLPDDIDNSKTIKELRLLKGE